jgi:hypothetical protein
MQKEVTRKELRSFGLLVGGIFAVIGVWPTLFRGEDLRLWAVGLAVVLILPALLWPRSLKLVYRVWMALGQVLGWINTRILLSVVFYVLFTPMGLVMRLMGKDPMRRRFEPDADTYRVVVQPRPSTHMTQQF